VQWSTENCPQCSGRPNNFIRKEVAMQEIYLYKEKLDEINNMIEELGVSL